MEILQTISYIITISVGAFGLLVAFVKPLRMKFWAVKKSEREALNDRIETDKCLLRDRILSSYFKHYKEGEIRQYEFENVSKLYAQYKKLGGNSFVCEIYAKMQEWTIIS